LGHSPEEGMMAAELISVYESADGGSGNPVKTFWNISVGGTSYKTDNFQLAETARLAILTNSKITVIADGNHKLSEIRIEVILPPTKAKKKSA
jgi:hypothetical protein